MKSNVPEGGALRGGWWRRMCREFPVYCQLLVWGEGWWLLVSRSGFVWAFAV